MNDNIEKPKPTVFYAKNKESQNRSRTDKDRSDGRQDKRNRSQWVDNQQKHDSNNRIETFNPSSAKKKPSSNRVEQKFNIDTELPDSPWHQKGKYKEKNVTNEREKSKEKDDLLTESFDVHRQCKEEIMVYSENSCKAVFKHRPAAIIKAFLTQEMTFKFKSLIEWLVSQRLGYDVVSNEQITKITDTPHHGGICLIIKKREPLSIVEYLEQSQDKEQDHVLAIDDVNNPHNLGGLVRTAAFYRVNGLIIRQISLLESGAAMRVAEGGTESVVPLKTDDLILSLDLFKQKGYQIVALLPCQVSSINAVEINKMTLTKKVVFVIFQRINLKLVDCADQVIYLKGNENMAALNISVATGILLSQIK